MCGNGIYSTSDPNIIQLKRALLGVSVEPKLRPYSQNKNSTNEDKKSLLKIANTVSISLDIHRGQAPNTKQKENYG